MDLYPHLHALNAKAESIVESGQHVVDTVALVGKDKPSVFSGVSSKLAKGADALADHAAGIYHLTEADRRIWRNGYEVGLLNREVAVEPIPIPAGDESVEPSSADMTPAG